MIAAFARALSQLVESPLRRVLLLSLALAAAVFAALWAAIGWLLVHTAISKIGWVDTALDVFGGVAALALSLILFPAVVTLVQTNFLLEPVAAAVEARHYPGLPTPRAPPLREQIVSAARFLALAIGLNLAALPLYLVPGINVVSFLALNGYLLARENFDALASRRLDPDAARQLWRRRRARFVLAGCAFALAASVPIVNLAAAIFAAAASVHLIELYRHQPTA